MKKLSDSDVSHIIFTRFNVRSGGKERSIRDQSGWLKGRYELFDIYCFPSIVAQTDKNFKWLVFFDEETPEEYKKKNEAYQSILPQFTPVYVGEWTTETVNSAINAAISPGSHWLLTTRLDNDDGLNSEFVKTLKDANFTGATYFNFPDGLTFSDGDGYAHQDLSNAFLSYVEPVDNFEGVWKYPHPEVIKKFDVKQLALPYAWLQVIHGGNVSNKVRGKVERPESWQAAYSNLTRLTVNKLSIGRSLLDFVFHSNYRRLRDRSIWAIKLVLRR
ncbi:MAG: hypothetical protein CMI67_14185 [Pelagibaca sp.]|nr:hypothetical protein [Pelagibaca sp.]|tara:strand:+ start:449 stop:1270 length:822 start_codon:yes stop_codon:yes gene_type:complete